MKFSVGQHALLTALSVVGKGMSTTSTIPLLSGIYIKADNGALEFQTNNLTISIRHKIPANVEESGEVVVSGKILNAIVKSLPDAAVVFEGSDRILTITCLSSLFRLNTLDAKDWSEFPALEPSSSCELPSAVLSEMIDKVYKVTSKENSRPILQGVLLTSAENTLRLVATDSYRLAVCETYSAAEADAEDFTIIIPGTVFHDVLTMPSLTEKILIGTTNNQIVFSFGDTTYISRKTEGSYPDYRQLLPKTYATALTADPEQFLGALRRVATIAATMPIMRLDIDADAQTMKLSITTRNQGESVEYIPVQVEGGSMSLSLNHHYVADCLASAPDREKIIIELQSPTLPTIFKSSGKINYLYLVMPSLL
ncbi:DNA polymerase III subunit beta [Coriobacteriales bacterium OH1046]|nr:DNA polymerase III subunit beta [Coriobacteriales bacterium OH1046]